MLPNNNVFKKCPPGCIFNWQPAVTSIISSMQSATTKMINMMVMKKQFFSYSFYFSLRICPVQDYDMLDTLPSLIHQCRYSQHQLSPCLRNLKEMHTEVDNRKCPKNLELVSHFSCLVFVTYLSDSLTEVR